MTCSRRGEVRSRIRAKERELREVEAKIAAANEELIAAELEVYDAQVALGVPPLVDGQSKLGA